MENQSGDGKTSPFGDGKGAPTGGRGSGGSDFVRDPRGGGSMPAKFENPAKNYPQQAGQPGFNPDSVPAGGSKLHADPPKPIDGTVPGGRKPYKLGFGGGNGPTEAGSIGGE